MSKVVEFVICRPGSHVGAVEYLVDENKSFWMPRLARAKRFPKRPEAVLKEILKVLPLASITVLKG